MSRLALLSAVLFLFSGCGQVEGTRIGVNYTAKYLCSCLFVMEREQDSCYGDMIGEVQQIPVEVDAEARTVRASIFGLITGEARYERGRGCSLE